MPDLRTLVAPEAREVIGVVQRTGKPALRMLEQEGFGYSGMVDIFEAGPIVACPWTDTKP